MQLFGRPKRSCILRAHSTENMAVLKGKYFSCLVNQHLCCWGAAYRILWSKLQFQSQHCYRVNSCWIPFMRGEIAAQGWMFPATTWCPSWKEETALLVPGMMRVPDPLCLSPPFKAQISKVKNHVPQSELWASHTLRRGWPWPRASHCHGHSHWWRVERFPLWVWYSRIVSGHHNKKPTVFFSSALEKTVLLYLCCLFTNYCLIIWQS